MNQRALTEEVVEQAEASLSGQAVESSSWYLDPLAALQKRRTNLEVVRQAMKGLDRPPRVVLKTDLFEEANGDDQLLFDLDLGQQVTAGFDMCSATAIKAGNRAPRRFPLLATDARHLALASNSVDLIISTSTLDHMDGAADLEQALAELYRVLRPGGRMALTLDNPWNPVYPILRMMCATPWAPFELGYTTTRSGLDRALRKVGFQPLQWRPIVHNPRLVSTVWFMLLRRVMGKRAETWIQRSLDLFDRFENLPTRWLSCCFMAVSVEKSER